MTLRPHRVQRRVVQAVLSERWSPDEVADILDRSGIAALPEEIPAGPRDLDALMQELEPFVRLYRILQERLDTAGALALVRLAIVRSGLVSHASEPAAHAVTIEAGAGRSTEVRPLNLVTPPPPGFAMTQEALDRGFAAAMAHFSCEGRLLVYAPDEVRFSITMCHWCTVMERLAAPELIEFFCETDERFMDGHPTHELRLATTIGRGGQTCEFRFARRTGSRAP
jgi:hypothetical protein